MVEKPKSNPYPPPKTISIAGSCLVLGLRKEKESRQRRKFLESFSMEGLLYGPLSP